MKQCKQCRKVKEDNSFDKSRHQCKKCRNEYKKTLYSRSGSGLRAAYLRRFYGLKPGTYETMLAAQNGVCAICVEFDNGPWNRLAVDHNHVTGKIRGLLCTKCNKGLGQFNDSPDLLRKAADYLERVL